MNIKFYLSSVVYERCLLSKHDTNQYGVGGGRIYMSCSSSGDWKMQVGPPEILKSKSIQCSQSLDLLPTSLILPSQHARSKGPVIPNDVNLIDSITWYWVWRFGLTIWIRIDYRGPTICVWLYINPCSCVDVLHRVRLSMGPTWSILPSSKTI